MDFSHIDHLSIPDICLIALAAREIATQEVPVRLVFPRNNVRASQLGFLSAIGLRALFEDSPWISDHLVQFDGEPPSPRAGGAKRGLAYVPLQWLDATSFEETEISPSLATPPLMDDTRRDLYTILERSRVLHSDSIGTVVDSVLTELAWNTVIHSRPGTQSGVGVLAAQVSPSEGRHPPHVVLSVTDLGCGIASSLAPIYASSSKAGHYEKELKCSADSAILRFSLDQDGTSRTVIPMEYDETSLRGLTQLCEELRENGQLSLFSGTGGLTLRSEHRFQAKAKDGLEIDAFPGSQVTVTLRELRSLQFPFHVLPSSGIDQFTVKHFCNPQAHPIHSSAPLDPSVTTEGPIVVDLGYSERSLLDFQRAFRRAHEAYPKCPLILWNVRTAWGVCRPFLEKIFARTEECPPCLVVRAFDDVYEIANPAVGTTKPPWTVVPHNNSEASLGVTHGSFVGYQEIAHAANSQFVESSFVLGAPEAGFFSGAIRLLDGRIVGRFFAMNVHAPSAVSPNTIRWAESLRAALARLLEKEKNADLHLALIGLTSPTRAVLQCLSRRFHSPHRATVLMATDLPGRPELELAVRGCTEVVIVADVIATGDLVQAVVDSLSRVGPAVLGITTALDARGSDDPPILSRTGSPLPVIACGSFERQPLPDATIPTQWLDPIALRPSDRAGLVEPVDRRVAPTLDLVVSEGVATIGHIADGVRHSSVYVNIWRLLEHEATHNLVGAELDQVLDRPTWSDFRPAAVLYPVGIGRIEEVGSHALAPQADQEDRDEQLVSGVRQFALSVITRRFSDAQLCGIPRSFDPSGRSRCARRAPDAWIWASSHRDIVIVDDGLSTGKTAREMLHVAMEHGAKRILVVALLGRLNQGDARYWEGVDEFSLREADGALRLTAQITVIIPLILPIPFFTRSDAPSSIQRAALTSRYADALGLVGRVARRLSDNLRPRLPHDARPHDVHSATWIRILAYAELSREIDLALPTLRTTIARASVEGHDATILRLFSEESHLLDTPRLRKGLGRDLEALAVTHTTVGARDKDTLLAAITLLRTRFHRRFVERVADAFEGLIACNGTQADLERVVFQLATVAPDLEGVSRARRDVKNLLLAKRGSVETDSITVEALSALRADTVPGGEPLTNVTPAQVVRRLLDWQDRERHGPAVGFIELIAAMGSNAARLRKDDWRDFSATWEGGYSILILQTFRPLLVAFDPFLDPILLAGHPIPSDLLLYLSSPDDLRSGFMDDLRTFGAALEFLSYSQGQSAGVRDDVCARATRLSRNVFARDSGLAQILRDCSSHTVDSLDRFLRNEVAKRLQARRSGVRVEISPTIIGPGVGRERNVVASRPLAERIVERVVSNVLRYAYPPERREDISLGITIQPAGQAGGEQERVDIEISNRGQSLHGAPSGGRSFRTLTALLKRVGGELGLPRQAGEIVVERIQLSLL